MADGSATFTNTQQPTEEITVGYEPDFYRATWDRSKLPGPLSYRLENIDRRVNAVNSLSKMLGAHMRGKEDAANNEGVRYAWLSDRQAAAIADAVTSLLSTVCEEMESVRQDAIFHNVNSEAAT